MKRSLITLKALTYMPTGGIVAAATTSLPEHIGGPRNWDYRICWLRDATATLLAFMNLGYFEEAAAWREWLMRTAAGDPGQMQIMYGVAGERRLPEWEVPWLSGFMGSLPVRVGNAASEQFQLDIYGEVADAMTQARKGGLPPHPRAPAIRNVIMRFLEDAWRRPDEGIWEVRGGRQHFTHSKVMAWVAFDRAATLAAATDDGANATRWRKVADEIHADVCRRGYRSGARQLRAGLRLEAVRRKPPAHPAGRLPAGHGSAGDRNRRRDRAQPVPRRLLLRYHTTETKDGLPAGEGVFIACSFWLADVKVLHGRYAEARLLFERLRRLCNDVGLLSEEYDPAARADAWEFPAGLQPCWADQHGAEPSSRRGAGGRTRESGER